MQEADGVKDQPIAIVAKTDKGHGLHDIENKNGFHGKPFTDDQVDIVIEKLKNNFKKAAEYKTEQTYAPKMPKAVKPFDPSIRFAKQITSAYAIQPSLKLWRSKQASADRQDERCEKRAIKLNLKTDPNTKLFDKNQSIATRKAYGYALAALGREDKNVFALDGDVKNSTFSDIFEKEFPDRFVQCFIAEQSMVGITTGLQLREKIAFAATFGAFFARAYDQIRMAGIGRNALRLCGSHCGVSIGQDGPSQMALEDIAMFAAVPNSVILYPSDGVSAYKLVELMANYNDGVSYLRTSRPSTPIIYDKDEEFKIGGCKVLKQSDNDKACIIAAGVTLYEALKAYEILKEKNIFVSVIDLYSVKPLDKETVKNIAKKSGNKIITVEDHYIQGGLGQIVASAMVNEGVNVTNLAVTDIARSAQPEELLSLFKIDAESIVEQVLSLG